MTGMCGPVSTEIPLQTLGLDLAHRHAKGQQAARCSLHVVVEEQGVPARG